MLDNSNGSGDINVSSPVGNDFSRNGSVGLEVFSQGSITLDDVMAVSNTGDGAYLNNVAGSGDITVKDGTFGYGDSAGNYGNGSDGLEVDSSGNISLNDVEADDNTYDGAYLGNTSGLGNNIEVDNSNFGYGDSTGAYGNKYNGLVAFSDGNIILNKVTADNNSMDGVLLNNLSVSSGNITVTSSHMCNNAYNDIETGSNGSVALNGDTYSTSSPQVTSSSNCSSGGGGSGKSGTNVGSGSAPYTIIPQTQSQLPGGLTTGNTFGSALKIILNGQGTNASGLVFTLSFPIPDSMKNAKLASCSGTVHRGWQCLAAVWSVINLSSRSPHRVRTYWSASKFQGLNQSVRGTGKPRPSFFAFTQTKGLCRFDFFDDDGCFRQQSGDGADGGQLRSDQRADHAERHRDFHHRFAILVFDDDAADVSLMDQFLDSGQKFFAVDVELFRAKLFFRHWFLLSEAS